VTELRLLLNILLKLRWKKTQKLRKRAAAYEVLLRFYTADFIAAALPLHG
jgi:hypothetical protein